MTTVTGKALDVSLLSRIFSFSKPYRKIFYSTLILTLLMALLGPVRPWLTQVALDEHIATGDFNGLLIATLLMIAVLIIQSFIQFFNNYQSSLLGQFVIRDLRVKLFGHLLHFGIPYYDKTPIGTPVTRTISDMETIADIFSDGVIIIIGDILQLVVIISYMFYVDWQLTLISLCTIPFLAVATNIFKNSIKNAFNDVRTQVAALNVFVQEHLTGIRIVQMFNREEKELEQFRNINRQHRDANIRSVWYYSIFFPVVDILSAISIGLLVWWGAGEVIRDKASFGIVVAFIMYINLLFRPIRELADKFNTLQMGMVSSERILKVLDTPSGDEEQGNSTVEHLQGTIEFKNVWFAYKDEDWVLKDVSFKIEPGTTLAIVGATGSGKSTVINLISRFYEITKGEILIDGVNIKQYRISELRKRIAVVLQDVFLFSDTISNNITLGDENITPDKVKKGAASIGVDSFLESLPGKYEYLVGERGNTLSMGQRQLISFVRAFVHEPAILILDEATSSIDSESEELITRATNLITQNRTSIVIAHRLATVQHADKILVLDRGIVVEEGTHNELLKIKKYYHRLYEVQFADNSYKLDNQTHAKHN